MMKVALIGTQGVPANYGGFETLVENIIGENSSPDVQYTVFCSAKDLPTQLKSYKGASLRYISLSANGMMSILYDGISLLKAMRGYDVIVVLGVSGGLFFPIVRLFSRARLIVNIDGLEWKRAKWNWFARFFLRLSEEVALRFANIVIGDNQGVVNYIKNRYQKKTVLIAYGSDHVLRQQSEAQQQAWLDRYGLTAKNYSLAICRIEPENNCEMILQTYACSTQPLVFIGNWSKNHYGIDLKRRYSTFANITIIESLYDLDTLYALRVHSKYYIHGHSAGGTNPSLVEAMLCGCNIIAYDVIYNRETTEHQAHYFSNPDELLRLTTLKQLDSNAFFMVEIARRRYTWGVVAKQYEALYPISRVLPLRAPKVQEKVICK